MQYYYSKKDALFTLLVVLCLVCIGILGTIFIKTIVVPLVITVSTVIIVCLLLHLRRHIHVQMEQHRDVVLSSQTIHYNQLEAALTLLLPLMPDTPLPSFRGWAASPDFLLETVREMGRIRPEVVLETGSGASTIVIGLYLKKAQRGRLISLEHNPEYYSKTKKMVDLHDLGDYVDLVYSPLTEVSIAGEKWKWYDLESVDLPSGVDLIVIDGPPEHIQTEARFPGVPLLKHCIHGGTVILVDDGRREGEKNAVSKWLSILPGFTADYLPLEKGAFRLYLSNQDDS